MCHGYGNTPTNQVDNNFPILTFQDGQEYGANGTWVVPKDFSSLTSVKALMHTGAGGDIYLSQRQAQAYASGQNYNNRSDSVAAGVVTLTVNQVNRVDITDAVSGITLAADDIVGMGIKRDATHVSDTIATDVSFHGFLIEYVRK